MPEGTIGMMEVEFTALKAPQGNQLNTLDVGQNEGVVPAEPKEILTETKEIVVEQKPEAVVVAPPPSPKRQQTAQVLPEKSKKLKLNPEKKEVKKITVEESPVPLKLPKASEENIVDNDLEELEATENNNELIDTDDDDIDRELEKEEEAAALLAARDLEERSAEDNQTMTDEKIIVNPIDKLDKKIEDKVTDNIVENTKEELVAKPDLQEQKAQPAPPALTKGLPEKTQKLRQESNLNYGIPSGVRDVKVLVQAPGNVPPQYPAISRHRREMGQVRLMYFVTNDGQVSQLKLVKTSGYAELDQEAIRAIQKYRFRPGQEGTTSHTVNFVLYGDATPAGGTLRTSSTSDVKTFSPGLRN